MGKFLSKAKTNPEDEDQSGLKTKITFQHDPILKTLTGQKKVSSL